MAFQFCNMERFPQLLPLIQHAAENDPSAEVRREALRGMARISPPQQLIAYYQSKLNQNPDTETLWAIISGLRDHNKTARPWPCSRGWGSTPTRTSPTPPATR
jgi:hypothetical protein